MFPRTLPPLSPAVRARRRGLAPPVGLSLADADLDRDGADELLNDLYQRDGLDLAAYGRASLLRRILYRMRLLGIAGCPEYRAYLAADPAEHQRLRDAVPVHRTEFYRDREVWAYLADEVVPGILAAKGAGEPVRAWSAGCASGEEAYTLAVVLAEAMGLEAFRERVTVFATDVSDRAIAEGRAGRYAARRMAGVPPALREGYFSPAGDAWTVRPELRERVVFSRHDLLRDPPFSRLDLIFCRNTLIYFTPAAQVSVLAALYLGLREGGALFTGKAENPHLLTDLFEAECRSRRVFRRAGGRTGKALVLSVRR
ncbi:protein-glutamate O-methyltransferase CheR [Sorangium sp. So ce260]|uniref:CheR family methyltransferase n=1 Tax=Sorangium sp. So ce260 TaxID=3133291 RepID=UPI003F609D82